MFRRFYIKIFNKQRILNKISILGLITLGFLLLFNLNLTGIHKESLNHFNDEFSSVDKNLMTANRNDILFESYESPLNVTDFGNLYEYNQEVSLNEVNELNLTYYLDDVHDWKVSKIKTSINNLQDTKNWVNNSDFLPINIYRVDQVVENTHKPYHNNEDWEDSKVISHSGAIAIRVHFDYIKFESHYDYARILNNNSEIRYVDTGFKNDFFSPWIKGDELTFQIYTDVSNMFDGYSIDYYQFTNSSSNYYINDDTWDFNEITEDGSEYGPGIVANSTAMYLSLFSALYTDGYDYYSHYPKGNFTEINQNLIIPRGKAVNAYISFDYYPEFCMESNNLFIYVEINNKKIYSVYFGDIYSLGLYQWHSTEKIYMDLWVNNSNIFEDDLINQNINISIGLKSISDVYYSAYEDGFQQVVWFDNITLGLTCLTNSSQNDLTINNEDLIEGVQWGQSSLELDGIWDTDPLVLTVNTLSSLITFDLDTILYGYHNATTKINQQNDEGISFVILYNGTIMWEFYHNLFMPSLYTDFEFIMNKPSNWRIISVLDPTLQLRSFKGGEIGDLYLKVNKTNAIFPGWWTFKATSPNYLTLLNTKMLKQGEWTHTSFVTGESTKIKTQVNYSNNIPPNLATTLVNLTIFDPQGNIWYKESLPPLSNGTVIFSEITFTSQNTIGGQYNYTLFWNNGTALGGIKSNFIVNHFCSLKLLKPDDAKLDLRTDGFVGDIIPVRVFLQDYENNNSISNSIVFFNWTDGTHYFTEAALGIYETILDSADLGSRGLYNILIESSKIGFFGTNITLEINLGEETKLQRLESEYNIELHANSNIKFKFMDYSDNGIDGAIVNISINNPLYYSIENIGAGIYDIEFSTLYIVDIGMYQLNFSFEATGYEPQYYVYNFQIIEQSVNLSISINSLNIEENSLLEIIFYDTLNISARSISIIDKNYITGGIFTWVSATYKENLSETINYLYNSSIQCLPTNFTFGINYVYLEFKHPNYRTQTFGFQLLINQIEFNVNIIGFEDTVNVDVGGTLNLQIQLLDPETSALIDNATVSYSWDYGVGTLTEITPGTYQLNLNLPENLQGNFIFNLIISKEGTVYKMTQHSFLLTIGEPGFPSWIIWLILIGSSIIIAILGVLSLRSYVIVPRRRKKASELIERTQRYKDLKNIQAVVIIHRISGIPIYSKSYSILEKHKKELFSGFIQAITTIGEELVGTKEEPKDVNGVEKISVVEKILELDFKQFFCLICDRADIRIVFVLKEKASERLKQQISNLALGITLQLSEQIEHWDGSLDKFEISIPPIIKDYIELFYKDSFKLNDAKFIAQIRKENDLNKMETRILNVIHSIAKSKTNFYLEHILEIIHELNKDLVIEALESIIKKRIIIPS